VLDGFDFTILTFILIDIQKTFAIDAFLAGILGTITLVARLLGGVVAGSAADRWGRKLPLMISIVWFSVFAGLSGFSTSYAMLFACRALFGVGMGGEWAAGMPLVLEHWPTHLRGIASGLLQSGYGWGYILSAAVFTYIYPLVEGYGPIAWRLLLWLGIGPALLVLWIRSSVDESPVWLARQRVAGPGGLERVSFTRLFGVDTVLMTAQASLLMSAFMFSFYSLTYWYPTMLRDEGHSTQPYIVLFNLGGIAGAYLCGRLSESRMGRRGAASAAGLLAIGVVPLYVFSNDSLTLGLGALIIGLTAQGMWGIVPAYLIERFPTHMRSLGAGLAYHIGAALGSFTPAIVGALHDRGWTLPGAMAVCIVTALCLVVGLLWLGPETRGRRFS
jgi:SHS family lactate transporter-like MFS transporter